MFRDLHRVFMACTSTMSAPAIHPVTAPSHQPGGHLHADGQTHGQHMGDLPSLLVTEQGFALLAFTTDRFTLDDLMDEDWERHHHSCQRR